MITKYSKTNPNRGFVFFFNLNFEFAGQTYTQDLMCIPLNSSGAFKPTFAKFFCPVNKDMYYSLVLQEATVHRIKNQAKWVRTSSSPLCLISLQRSKWALQWNRARRWTPQEQGPIQDNSPITEVSMYVGTTFIHSTLEIKRVEKQSLWKQK